MLVAPLDFLKANDQNGVRLSVVKYLASQRASSIQALVAYFIAVRLVLINRISLQHCRPAGYVQESNAEPASSLRTDAVEGEVLVSLENRKPSTERELLCATSRDRGLGVRVLSQRALGAPSPRCTLGGALVMPRKIWPGPAHSLPRNFLG
jgi:hypothetical protein